MNVYRNENEPSLDCSFKSRSAECPTQEQPQKVLSNKFITISYVTIHCLWLYLWFTRSHELLSNFSQQKQSQEFLFLFIFPSQFSTKSLAVQFVCLCVCCNVCFEIEIWKCLKVVGHHRGAQATAFSHGFPFFSLNLWRIFPVWRQSWQNS